MNFSSVIDPQLCVRLVLTLGHFLWQGAVVTAAGLLVAAAMRRAAASARYAVLLATLLVMALCPLVTFCVVRPSVQRPG